VFVAYAVFTFFLLPISIQASQSIPYEGIPDFGTFIVYLFIMLALLLFGIVSLYGRSLGKGYGLIAYSLGILSGFIALYMAAYVAGELNLTGTCP
jgi:hypothetical protein